MARPEKLSHALPGIWRLLVFMKPYIRRQKAVLSGAFGALFLGVIMRALEPWPLKFVFDYAILPNGAAQAADKGGIDAWLSDMPALTLVAWASASLVVILLVRSICLYYEKVGFAVVGNRVLTQVRAALFRHIQTLSMSFHNRSRSGDLLVRVMGDIGMLKQVSVTAFMPLLGNILVLLLMAVLMLWLHWKLAIVVLISAPLYWLPTLHFGRRIRDVSRVQRQREGKMASGTSEMISAMQLVKTLSLEDAFADQFTSDEQKSLKEGVKFRRLLAKLRGTVQLMTGVSTAAVLFYGTWLVLQGELTAGSLLVFLSYLKAAFKPLQNFAKYSGRVAKASAAGDRVIDLFEIKPEVRDLPGAQPAPRFEGHVRFEDVGFAYDNGQPVLVGVSFDLRPGQMLAITGESGAGKSTLIELLPRLHDVQQGRVLVDGKDIREYTLASLRAQFAFVLQDTLLFAATIRENIAYGNLEASDEEIEQAARLAAAHEFIMRQADGYETIVGERGVTLSVGQRQRIAVARAAVSDARILILDEPLASLDEDNQEQVLKALYRLAEDRTTIMITHDPEHARRADLVLHLENGQIARKDPA